MFAAPAAQAKTTFVQDQRVNSLTLEYTTDSFAPHNAIGTAVVGSIAQNAITSSLASAVADGSLSWMFEMRDLSDLTGTNDASFHVSVFNPTPVAGAGYNGASDLDWWYLPNASELNPDGSAKQQLPASFVSKALTAGPGDITVNINFAGASLPIAMSNVQIKAVAGATSTPLEATGDSPPGHLASEYVDPSLVSFGSMSGGMLSGDVSARSLSNVLVPSSFTGADCGNLYTAANTILDVLVSGCKALGVITEINAVQPDTVTSSGSGTYTFAVNSSHEVVSCQHNGTDDTLSDCLDGAAYSIYFQFTTDRVMDQLEMADGKLLTVNKAGPGSGTVTDSPVGLINCGSDCGEPYDAGTEVTLVATPEEGSEFTGWGGDCTGTGTCKLKMSADRTVTANFAPVRCHVPNVKGKPLAEAKTAIVHAHCAVGTISKAYSAKVKSGRVISENPAPGTTRPQGSKVALKLSKGKKH